MLLKHIQYIIFLFTNLLFSQSYSSRYHSFPFELTLNEKSNLSLVKYGDLSPYFNQNKHLVLSYSSYFSSIKGHRNIDNYGVLSSQTGLNLFNSMSLKYQNKWLFVRVEPFQTLNRPLSADEKKLTLNESYQYLNHHTTAKTKKSIYLKKIFNIL